MILNVLVNTLPLAIPDYSFITRSPCIFTFTIVRTGCLEIIAIKNSNILILYIYFHNRIFLNNFK